MKRLLLGILTITLLAIAYFSFNVHSLHASDNEVPPAGSPSNVANITN